MKTSILLNSEHSKSLQEKLDANGDSAVENSISGDVWEFPFEYGKYKIHFGIFSAVAANSFDYLCRSGLSAIDLAKLLVLELSSKKSSPDSLKVDVDTIFVLVEYLTKHELTGYTEIDFQGYVEYYLMHNVSANGFFERLSPRNFNTARTSLNQLTEVNHALSSYGFPPLLQYSLNYEKIIKGLRVGIEVVSGGELTFGEWRKGGTFNRLTLDYGRYYIEYCAKVFSEHYEKALAMTSVISRMNDHLSAVGLKLHKNTQHLFYGLLSGEDVISSVNYKNYKTDKVERLKARITEDYTRSISTELREKKILSPQGITNIAKRLGITRAGNRDDKAEQYRTELERLRKIIYLYLGNNQDPLVEHLLSASRQPIDLQKFATAVRHEAVDIDKHEIPDSGFYSVIGIGSRKYSKPRALTFIHKVRSAGVTCVVSFCGWRGSEFGFPISSISRIMNEDLIDQYTSPFRYIVNWPVFKTHKSALSEREITSSVYELITSVGRLINQADGHPALYPAHLHAEKSTSRSTSHSAIRKSVVDNWHNYVKANDNFQLLDEIIELRELVSAIDSGCTLTPDKQRRIKELHSKSSDPKWKQLSVDPNIIEAKRRTEEELARVMFAISTPGEYYQKSWLSEYQDYLRGGKHSLNLNTIRTLDEYLPQDVKLKIKASSKETCANKTFITQVSNKLVDGCLYPTPHAFRHMWAEAVYRRFDGDAGWMIRSQFKHVSKSMFLAYISDKDNRRLHDTIRVRIASSLMKNWLRKKGSDAGGRIHVFLRKLFNLTTVRSLNDLDATIDRLVSRDIYSIKANPWGFCIARTGTSHIAKCWDGQEINPHNATPNLCMRCINNLTMASNVDYIVLHAWQHIDLLESEHLHVIPASLKRESAEYVEVALKRIRELAPSHKILPRLQSLAEIMGKPNGLF